MSLCSLRLQMTWRSLNHTSYNLCKWDSGKIFFFLLMKGIFDSFEKLSMEIIFNIRAIRDLKERLQYISSKQNKTASWTFTLSWSNWILPKHYESSGTKLVRGLKSLFLAVYYKMTFSNSFAIQLLIRMSLWLLVTLKKTVLTPL